MARSLLHLFLLLVLYSMNVNPASAQHIFLDLNDDGVCTASDVLAFNQVDTVDVWIDTSKNQDGSPALAPGKYRLGRAGYQSTSGCPYMFVVPQDANFPAAETKFYSRCPGSQVDYFIRLASDFQDACGTSALCDGIRPTTWGHIKDIYR